MTDKKVADEEHDASFSCSRLESDCAIPADYPVAPSRKRVRVDNGSRRDEQSISSDLTEYIASSTQTLAPSAETSSTTAPSSLPSKDAQLFSDPVQSDDGSDLSYAPSSTTEHLLSPVPSARKRIFSSLKRKHSNVDVRACGNGEQEPLSVIAHNARKTPRVGKKSVRTQTRIDLGENPRKTCAQCGMEYVPTNSEDAALHHDFHHMDDTGIEVGPVLMRDPATRLIAPKKGTLGHNEAVLMVDRRSSVGTRKKIKKILDVVNTELSAPQIDDEALWGSINPGRRMSSKRKIRNEPVEDVEAQFKAFIYLTGDKCIGVCLVQKISLGYKVVEPSVDECKHMDNSARAQSSSISITNTPEAALLGVTRIWTSRSFRRRGIAEILLDCARRHFFYGLEVTKDLVAFSQPTESGAKLAKRWYGIETGWHIFRDRQAEDAWTVKRSTTGV